MLTALVLVFGLAGIVVAWVRGGGSFVGAYTRSRAQLRQDLRRPSRWLPPLLLVVVFFVGTAAAGSAGLAATAFAALVVAGFLTAIWLFGRR